MYQDVFVWEKLSTLWDPEALIDYTLVQLRHLFF